MNRSMITRNYCVHMCRLYMNVDVSGISQRASLACQYSSYDNYDMLLAPQILCKKYWKAWGEKCVPNFLQFTHFSLKLSWEHLICVKKITFCNSSPEVNNICIITILILIHSIHSRCTNLSIPHTLL